MIWIIIWASLATVGTLVGALWGVSQRMRADGLRLRAEGLIAENERLKRTERLNWDALRNARLEGWNEAINALTAKD